MKPHFQFKTHTHRHTRTRLAFYSPVSFPQAQWRASHNRRNLEAGGEHFVTKKDDKLPEWCPLAVCEGWWWWLWDTYWVFFTFQTGCNHRNQSNQGEQKLDVKYSLGEDFILTGTDVRWQDHLMWCCIYLPVPAQLGGCSNAAGRSGAAWGR